LILLSILLALLTGCDGGPGARFDDYLARLGRTLEVEPPEWRAPSPEPPPRTGQLRIPLKGSAVDTLDFLALRGCALQVTIGKRNSSLGRLASDSQRLLLELEFLQLAPACIDTLEADGKEELAATLRAAQDQKRAQLKAMIFNATLANREYRELWTPPVRLDSYPAQTGSRVITALEGVERWTSRWLAGDYSHDNEGFELLLSEVALADGGALASALGLQAAALAAADALLQRRLERGPLCSPGRRPAAADVLETVVRKFFVGGIQGWSAEVERRRQALLPPLRSLEAQLASALPAEYRDWAARRDARLDDHAAAPRRHVEQLKRLLDPCDSGGG
jgi:hypothetical protein